MDIIIVRERVVFKLLKLKRGSDHSSTRPDKIPAFSLNQAALPIAPYLTKMIQLSLDHGRIPDEWRKASIVPIYKKGEKHQFANYRPVSLTSISCTIPGTFYPQYSNCYGQLRSAPYPLWWTTRFPSPLIVWNTVDHYTWSDSSEHGPGAHDRYHLVGLLKSVRQGTATMPSEALPLRIVGDYTNLDQGLPQSQDPVIAWCPRPSEVQRTKFVLRTSEGLGHKANPVSRTRGTYFISIRCHVRSTPGDCARPLLFLAYINDLPECTTSDAHLFADDCLVYREIRNQDYADALQTRSGP